MDLNKIEINLWIERVRENIVQEATAAEIEIETKILRMFFGIWVK